MELYHPNLDVTIDVPERIVWVHMQKGWIDASPVVEPPAVIDFNEEPGEEPAEKEEEE